MLFLRPTESATVFLQQLGRGLRRTRDKAVLTVLDFVGHHRKEFRFDVSCRALTGQHPPRARARDRAGLPVPAVRLPDRHGPAGAEPGAREHPRRRSRTAGSRWWPSCARTATTTSRTFLDESGIELSDILRRGSHSWTRLRRDAGLPTASGLRDGGATAQARPRLRSRRRPARGRRHTSDCSPTTRRPTPSCPPASSGWPGCSSSRSGPTAAVTPRTTRAWPRCGASEPLATSSASVVDICRSTRRGTMP